MLLPLNAFSLMLIKVAGRQRKRQLEDEEKKSLTFCICSFRSSHTLIIACVIITVFKSKCAPLSCTSHFKHSILFLDLISSYRTDTWADHLNWPSLISVDKIKQDKIALYLSPGIVPQANYVAIVRRQAHELMPQNLHGGQLLNIVILLQFVLSIVANILADSVILRLAQIPPSVSWPSHSCLLVPNKSRNVSRKSSRIWMWFYNYNLTNWLIIIISLSALPSNISQELCDSFRR